MHSKTHKPSNTNSPEVLTLSGRSDVFALQNVQTEAMPPFLTRIKAAHFTGFCSSIKGSYRGVENVNETVIKLTARFVNLTELQIMSPLYHPSFASHSLSLSLSLPMPLGLFSVSSASSFFSVSVPRSCSSVGEVETELSPKTKKVSLPKKSQARA